MDGKVPGGRELYMNGESERSEVQTPKREVTSNPVDSSTKTTAMPGVSKSLPRYGTETDKAELSESFKFKSSTLDRKHSIRTRSIKSFGNLLSRMVSHVSQGSITSSKKQKALKDSKDGKAIHNGIDPPANNGPLLLQFTTENTPGNVGLKNHGNTCFMNAVLQCLSHTELLLEYFITNGYKNDIKRNNKHRSKKFGSRGELTDHLSSLFKSLWSCQYTSDISNDFKNVVGKYSNQYKGYAQHDAQEFLLWLLDKIHEDVNIAAKHKYKPNKSTIGRSDEVIAAETLANHSRCNNSFIYDIFQALYRSSLTCSLCKHHSNTFDPFLSVSLPIPQRCERPVYVTVVYHAAQPRQVRIGLLMNITDTVQDLRYTLATDTKIPQAQLILTEIYHDGFHRTFHDSQFLSDIHEMDSIYAIECPSAPPSSSKTTTEKGSGKAGKATKATKATAEEEEDSSFLPLVLLNKQGLGNHGKRFGGPIVLHVNRESDYPALETEIYKTVQPTCHTKLETSHRFQLRVVDGLTGYLPSDVDMPLLTPTIDRALSNCIAGGGPPHVKVVAEWDQPIKPCEDHVEEHASVKQVKMANDQPVLGTLDECFQLYTQEEKLGTDDAWNCPSCRKQQTGTTKTLSLWSLPDIFVIHLKRFKQVGMRRTKLNTLITFPISDLDMTRHVTKRSSSSSTSGSSPSLGNKTPPTWSPWRPNHQTANRPEDFIYDLYAVSNHYGNMQGGHYTAFCKNPLTKKWHTFDDLKVSEMSETTVVTRAAYLLFYQRRTASTTHMQNPQSWMHQLANIGYVHRAPRVPISKSHDDLLDTAGIGDTHSDSELDHSSQFTRCVNPYATMRMTRPSSIRSPSNSTSPTSPTSPPTPQTTRKNSLAGSASMGQLYTSKPPPHPSPSRPLDIKPRIRHTSHQSTFPSSSAPEFSPPPIVKKPWAKPPIQLPPQKAVNGTGSVNGERKKIVAAAEGRRAPLSPSESSDGTSSSGGERNGASQQSSPAHSNGTGGGKSSGPQTEWSRTIYLQESCV